MSFNFVSRAVVAAAVVQSATAAQFETDAAHKLTVDQSESSGALAAAYESFKAEHKVVRSHDSASYSARLAAFAQTQKEVKAHNRANKTWTAAINKFADWTQSEKEVLLGFRRLGEWWKRPRNSKKPAFLQTSTEVAASVDWRSSLTSSSFVKDQGACGSCWAVAVAGALEMRAEQKARKTPMQLSFKQLVDCVPNPDHCGGTGGCEGATAELAFQYVQQYGLSASSEYGGELSRTESCRASDQSAKVKTSGFVSLPVNRLQPLLEALNDGPVVVSVDGGNWMSYNGGVFSGCSRDATINHAVLAVGYGHDDTLGMDYWLIRNSWGAFWGENGYIRLQRHSSDEGVEGHCGIDHDPKEGVGCDGGPPTLPVCGMCGVLADSAYPEDVTLEE
eukprot:TRINITY_DN63971_c0_g1_i1.p1 TRINITY_DN63971_c0_g1~~TRINITY_DN63971_c0_g1_i1.p1  ORF type:complete len:391 (+),score=83.33 TRINITY_DN63971_c0_g1_i1:113-1285(+)